MTDEDRANLVLMAMDEDGGRIPDDWPHWHDFKDFTDCPCGHGSKPLGGMFSVWRQCKVCEHVFRIETD